MAYSWEPTPANDGTKLPFGLLQALFLNREKVWDFKPERHIQVDEAGNLAWFDELLDTWMGTCRGRHTHKNTRWLEDQSSTT